MMTKRPAHPAPTNFIESGKPVEYWLCADIPQLLQQVEGIPTRAVSSAPPAFRAHVQ